MTTPRIVTGEEWRRLPMGEDMIMHIPTNRYVILVKKE
jgi:hypothetical protein